MAAVNEWNWNWIEREIMIEKQTEDDCSKAELAHFEKFGLDKLDLKIIKFFNEKNMGWKNWNESTKGTANNYWKENFLKPLISLMPDLKDKEVLDIGCGNGEIIGEVYNQGVKCVFGIDIDEQAIQNCKELNVGKGIFLKKGNAENIPFSDESFEVVYSIGLLEHFENPSKFLSEAKRVLKPNGELLIAIPNGKCLIRELKLKIKPSNIWERKYDWKQLNYLLENEDFKEVNVMFLKYSPIKLKLKWWLVAKCKK